MFSAVVASVVFVGGGDVLGVVMMVALTVVAYELLEDREGDGFRTEAVHAAVSTDLGVFSFGFSFTKKQHRFVISFKPTLMGSDFSVRKRNLKKLFDLKNPTCHVMG